jgi:hypothetical protein
MQNAPAACPGPCNTAWRKAEEAQTVTGVEHAIQPAWGQPTQCHGCVDRTREQLAAIPALIVAVLSEAVTGTPAKATGTIGRVTVATWPGQASRLLVDRIVGEMTELRADVLELRGISVGPRSAAGARPAEAVAALWSDYRTNHGLPATGRESHWLNASVQTLSAHWDWVMQHHPAAWEPWGRDNANPGGQVSGWYRTCLYFTKQDEQREVRRLAPCPRCHGPYLVESRELRLVNDEPYIECRDPDCRRIITRPEYDAYVKALNASIIAAA